MTRLSDGLIEELGGLTSISRMVRAPVSTVNSWKARISEARLHHLQLAAAAEGLRIDWASYGMAAVGDQGTAAQPVAEPAAAAATHADIPGADIPTVAEADSRRPFSPSCATCSPTSAPPRPPAGSPASSAIGERA